VDENLESFRVSFMPIKGNYEIREEINFLL